MPDSCCEKSIYGLSIYGEGGHFVVQTKFACHTPLITFGEHAPMETGDKGWTSHRSCPSTASSFCFPWHHGPWNLMHQRNSPDLPLTRLGFPLLSRDRDFCWLHSGRHGARSDKDRHIAHAPCGESQPKSAAVHSRIFVRFRELGNLHRGLAWVSISGKKHRTSIYA